MELVCHEGQRLPAQPDAGAVQYGCEKGEEREDYETWHKGAEYEDDRGGEKAAFAAEASQTAEKKETAPCIFRTAMCDDRSDRVFNLEH